MKNIITAIAMLVASQAQAQNVSVKYDNNIKHIHFSGDFDEGSELKLEKVIKAHPDIEWVTFNSYGGDLTTGNKINVMLDDYIMSAAVMKNHRCESACAIAFIGGERLSVEGQLKFHSWYYERYEGDGRIRIDKYDIRENIFDSQATTSLQLYYILRNGFSWDLHYDFSKLNGEYLNITNNAQLKKYYIGNIDFSKEYKDKSKKKFEVFSHISKKEADMIINKKQNVIKLSKKCLRAGTVYKGRVKFVTEGVKTFYQVEAGAGRTKRLKVLDNESWKVGTFKHGYVFLHSAKARESTYGWVNVKSLEKVCH